MLSPLVKPQALNGGMISSSRLTNTLYGTNDALDKRNLHSSTGIVSVSSFESAVTSIDAAKDVAESIANTMGIRSPYFVIGEIPEGEGINYIWSSMDKAAYGVIRAVANLNRFFTKQQGVIVDCLGDVSAEISVEFTSKPIFYQSTNVIDSRIRKPTVVRATVAISNYLADDAKGMALNQAASWDPTGAADLIRDQLLYQGYTRAQYALYRLKALMETGAPFTVYTPHGFYENMLIHSLKPQTNANNLDMLLCDITFQEAILTAPYASATELQNRKPVRHTVDLQKTKWFGLI